MYIGVMKKRMLRSYWLGVFYW